MLLSCAFLSKAQVSIQSNISSGVSFSSADALYCTITSTNSLPFKIRLIARVQQINGGDISVLTTEAMYLQPGINVIDHNIVQFSLDYKNKDLGFYELTNSHLPAGNYQYCVEINLSRKEMF